MKDEDFYNLRSALESALEDFKKCCDELGRDFTEETNDCLHDVGFKA